MKHKHQLEILEHLAQGLASEPSGLPQSVVMHALEERWGHLPDRPESFAALLDGGQRRGWISIVNEDGRTLVRGTGQLWMFVRKRWSEIPQLSRLRLAISSLIDAIVTKPADTLLRMDDIVPELDGPERAMAWDTLLAAAPGLAMQLSQPRDPKADKSMQIRFAQSMMDPVMLLRFVDIARDQPGERAMPLEVSA